MEQDLQQKLEEMCQGCENMDQGQLERIEGMLTKALTHCSRQLSSPKFESTELLAFCRAWAATLGETKHYKRADINQFIDKIVASIVITPCYEKVFNGSQSYTNLLAFETKESDGTQQRILFQQEHVECEFESNQLVYDTHWNVFDSFRIPTQPPPKVSDDLFYGFDDGLGDIFTQSGVDGWYLPLDEVFKQNKVWEIILALTDFSQFY